ncbi:hypothetical protein WEI85_37420 [Actinomycetes bacterium KLBMP 9797]
MRARTKAIPPLAAESVAGCVEAATRAPSIHNTQPWWFQTRGRDIDVYVDRARQLAVLDPSGRQLLMSVGAAVFNLRLALLARGRIPVQRLLPDPARPDLVARVSAGPTTTPSDTVNVGPLDLVHPARAPIPAAQRSATTTTLSRHRPATVHILVGLLVFLGLTALAGGIALTGDAGSAPPKDWLAEIPLIDSWVVLGIGFGLGSLVAAYGVLRRPRWPSLRYAEHLTRHHWGRGAPPS